MINIQNSRLVKVLSILSPNELKKFKKFTKSGYFNNSQPVISLLAALSPFHPLYDNHKCQAETIFQKTFPDEKAYNEAKLFKNMSTLTKLVFSFLRIREIEIDKSSEQQLLRQALIRRKNSYFLLKVANNQLKNLEKSTKRDTPYFLQKSLIFKDLYLDSIQQKFYGQRKFLTKSNDCLDQYYILQKLEYACSLYSRKSVSDEQNDLPSISQVVEWAKKQPSSEVPVIDLYVQLIQLYRTEIDDPLFEKILKGTKKHFKQIGKHHTASIFYQLLNYTFKRVRAKVKHFSKVQLELYKFGLVEEIFIQDGFLIEKTFLNIASSAAINKDFKFLDQFIQVYWKKLPLEQQELAQKLAYAIMYFHQGLYHQAYDIVFQFDESSLHHKLRIRLLLIRCLYEIYLRDDSYLKTLLDRIRTNELFLKREYGLQEEVRSSYLSFLASLRSIIHRNKYEPIKKTKMILLEELDKYHLIIAKDWLIEKIHQLKQ